MSMQCLVLFFLLIKFYMKKICRIKDHGLIHNTWSDKWPRVGYGLKGMHKPKVEERVYISIVYATP